MMTLTKQKIESLYNAPIMELTTKEVIKCILLLSFLFILHCIKIICLVSGILTLVLLIAYLHLDSPQYLAVVNQITSSGDLKPAAYHILQFYLVCSGNIIIGEALIKFIYQRCRK